MNTDDFEKRLQRQPLRHVPEEWRADILRAAEASTRNSKLETRNPHWLSTLSHQLSTFLWPHPKAWAALAASWILIMAVQFACGDRTDQIAKKMERPSPESVAVLRQQIQLLAELCDQSPPKDADRPKPNVSQPRSERRTNTLVA
jgi:hypothetical protein